MLMIAGGKWFVGVLFAALLVTGCSGGNSKSEENSNKLSETTEENSIVVLADTINSHLQADAVCVVDSRFERGHTIVFRANVVDQTTNETVENAKVKVVLATGDEYEMKLGPHGQEGTLLYTVSWTVPDDFPTGTLDYKIVAEVDGKEFFYEPFNVSLSKLTILEKGEEARMLLETQTPEEDSSEETAPSEGEESAS
ncbi:hypothetical protein [Ureibacillus sp. FSL K6-0786]|uniref:hypothetical protein n=1 Tax=Ureibacillus sp. FSL K6-0786 TaxID=2954607 RepID=UPI0030DBEEC2